MICQFLLNNNWRHLISNLFIIATQGVSKKSLILKNLELSKYTKCCLDHFRRLQTLTNFSQFPTKILVSSDITTSDILLKFFRNYCGSKF